MRRAVAATAVRVQNLLGPRYEVVEFDQSTGTSAEAAAAVGCDVAQIAKSFDVIWAAAGTPNAVFRLTPDDLEQLTGGRFAEIARR